VDGVALCARFSLATNRLQFCGPADAEAPLYRAAVTGAGSPEAASALLRFEALAPYLDLIAAKHGLDPLAFEVVEAYWIGNDLLHAFDGADFTGLLAGLERRGLPRTTADRLRRHLPEGAFPHHAFHVAFVGVGSVTGHVPTTLANLERCRPTPARVLEAGAGRLRVAHETLRTEAGRLVAGPSAESSHEYDPAWLPSVRPGDTVALHWGVPGLVLEPSQDRALATWSARAWTVANESLPALGAFAGARGPRGTSARAHRSAATNR
jgi:hypothetical protein